MEVYSWGGLTSRSKVRVLWLALLPFLFANLAGWMCPAGHADLGLEFRLHRLAAGLGGLALTVNAALIAVLISADVVAYQTTRAGIALHSGGSRRWAGGIAGHPARQVMLGVQVPGEVRAGAGLAGQHDLAYAAVRPPYRVSAAAGQGQGPPRPRSRRPGRRRVWDGESSVRLSPGCTSR